ncbi:inositol monophosphatase family protein [Gammaproteobacteria bacterium AS21]
MVKILISKLSGSLTMQPMLNIALRAARLASEHIQRAQEKVNVIRFEKSEVSELIEETAQQAEEAIAATIQKAYPAHSIQAQYNGEFKANNANPDAVWHISVIDNVKNFKMGLPQVAICLAGVIKGKVEHAVIINPATGQEFTASKGYGSVLDGRRIRVADKRGLEDAYIATDFSDTSANNHKLDSYLNITSKIHKNRGVLLNSGSPALNFADVAAGKIDGSYSENLQQATVLAASLLIQEAGGLVGDLTGGANFKKTSSLIGGNAKVFKSLVQTVASSLQA